MNPSRDSRMIWTISLRALYAPRANYFNNFHFHARIHKKGNTVHFASEDYVTIINFTILLVAFAVNFMVRIEKM